MATTLQSSRNAQFAPCLTTTRRQELIITDGINQNRRWDGVSSSTTKLGIDAPTAAATVTTPVGGAATAGVYKLYYRYKDADGNYSSLSPVASVTAAANDQFSWDTIPASSDTRVTNKELLRSLSGETAVLYLVATITNATTSYTSDTSSDATLSANTAVPIDNEDGSTNANRFDPPPLVRFAIPHLDRLYYFGRPTYSWGSVELTNGSATATGRGTNWTDQFDDWRFYVPGQTTEYTVDSISGQVITLSAVYAGTTNLFSGYSLRPEKNLRRRIYYSAVDEPESVRANDYIVPADDGEDYSGGFSYRKDLFVTEPNRMWRLFTTSMQGRVSENTKPGVGIQHAVYRGCVNNRCHVRSNEIVYLMDQDGVYAFDGGGIKDISPPIQNFFREDRINWSASEFFFATADDDAELIAFHVSLGDGYLPHFALVYHTGRERWECIEDYPWKMGAATTAMVLGRWRTLYGSEYGKFFISEGTLDGPSGERTIRGTATAASKICIVDDSSDAVLPTSGVVGASLALVAGPGNGERSRVVSSSSGILTVKQPFWEHPTTSTEYQVGGVTWSAKTGIYQFSAEPAKQPREIVLVAEPTVESASLDVRRYLDHASVPEDYVVDEDLGLGVSIDRDTPNASMNLKRVQSRGTFSGRRHWKLDGFTHQRLDNGRYVQVELRGAQGMDAVKVYGMILGGVTEEME